MEDPQDPIHGERVVYDIDFGEGSLERVFLDDDLGIDYVKMDLQRVMGSFDALPLVLARLIGEVLVFDCRLRGFFIG